MKALYIVPTRCRPNNARRLVEAFNKTVAHPSDVSLLLAIDLDDPMIDEYMMIYSDYVDSPLDVAIASDDRMRLGPTLNHYAKKYASLYDILGFMGDDHLPETYGWDVALRSVLEASKIGVAYANDGFQGPNLPTAVAMTSNIVRELGYFVPPKLIHLYMDNFWKDIGLRITSLHYLHNVNITHMHPQANKAEWDAQYVEVNSGEMWTHDAAVWDEYCKTALENDVAKLIELKKNLI